MKIDIYAGRPTRSGIYSMPRTGTKSTVVCDLPCNYHGLSFVAELWMRETRKDGNVGIEIEASLPKGVSFGPVTSAETKAFRKLALASAQVDVQYSRWEREALKRLSDAINGVEIVDGETDNAPIRKVLSVLKPVTAEELEVVPTVAPKTGHPATIADQVEAAKDGNEIDESVIPE